MLDDNGNLPKALRNEFKWEDLKMINILLGGSIQSLSHLNKESVVLRQNQDSREISNPSRIFYVLFSVKIFITMQSCICCRNFASGREKIAIQDLYCSCSNMWNFFALPLIFDF